MNYLEEISKLKEEKKLVSETATAIIQADIESLEKKFKELKAKAQKKHSHEFLAMGNLVGEMFRMAFELYTVHEIDIELKLTNYVQWIEINREYYKYTYYQIGEFGELIPDEANLLKVYDEVKRIYDETKMKAEEENAIN